ncbi:MAG: hypothetical protein PHE05_01545 [Bacilli bacterium]|nr:hypothetical protein [Bacilli bacterium]
MEKIKNIVLYTLVTLLVYVGLYLYYNSSVERGGMADLGAIITITYIIIPIYSLISGIVERLLIKNIYLFITSYIVNVGLLYIIIDNAISSIIISLAYVAISIVASFITNFFINKNVSN